MATNRICVFGDSTAWGAWDLEKGGWVNRLWLFDAEKTKNSRIYNLSVSGGTTDTILARFESEAKIRDADALIFQSGGNDASYEHTPGSYLVTPEKFERNVKEIIKRAREITDRILFIGFKNCDESKTLPVSWIDIYYTNENIERYNRIMKKVCESENVLFLDIFGLLDNDDLVDGLHPNAFGHEKIFEKVKSFLGDNKWL